MTFPFETLRRSPDVEAPGLVAFDAADRLLLDESAADRAAARAGEIVVIGDGYGALTLAALADGAKGVRVHQDAVTGERALAANAARLELPGPISGEETLPAGFRSMPLSAELVDGARVVLLRLPRSLDALRDIAGLIAAHAAADVVVYAGGRVKHMSTAMNEVLRDDYIKDSVAGVNRWNKVLEKAGIDFRLTVPHKAFNRQIGTFAGVRVSPDGRVVSETEWAADEREWLPSSEDRAYVASLMGRVTEPGKFANWIAPPPIGINRQPIDFEYVQLRD